MRFLAIAAVVVCVAPLAVHRANAEERTEERVSVSAETDEAEHDQFAEMGEYTQPAWAERNRFTATTRVYVLSPYEVFAGNVWEGIFARRGKTLHDLTQEIDLGLPHRFELGLENELGLAGTDAHETSASVEARYAFANWNVIPLNPALSAEYTFGLGQSVRDTSPPGKLHRQRDAVAVRLLLGQNFGDHLGYGINVGVKQDVSRSARQFEVNQSLVYGAMKGKVELGGEMRYAHRMSPRSAAGSDELDIGPSFG